MKTLLQLIHRPLHNYLENTRHHHIVDRLAAINAVISAVSLFPQLWLLLRGRPTVGLSTATFILILVNSAIWFIYGLHRKTPPLIVSSACNTCASVGILLLIAFR